VVISIKYPSAIMSRSQITLKSWMNR